MIFLLLHLYLIQLHCDIPKLIFFFYAYIDDVVDGCSYYCSTFHCYLCLAFSEVACLTWLHVLYLCIDLSHAVVIWLNSIWLLLLCHQWLRCWPTGDVQSNDNSSGGRTIHSYKTCSHIREGVTVHLTLMKMAAKMFSSYNCNHWTLLTSHEIRFWNKNPDNENLSQLTQNIISLVLSVFRPRNMKMFWGPIFSGLEYWKYRIIMKIGF